jgi:hypothetical protein
VEQKFHLSTPIRRRRPGQSSGFPVVDRTVVGQTTVSATDQRCGKTSGISRANPYCIDGTNRNWFVQRRSPRYVDISCFTRQCRSTSKPIVRDYQPGFRFNCASDPIITSHARYAPAPDRYHRHGVPLTNRTSAPTVTSANSIAIETAGHCRHPNPSFGRSPPFTYVCIRHWILCWYVHSAHLEVDFPTIIWRPVSAGVNLRGRPPRQRTGIVAGIT